MSVLDDARAIRSVISAAGLDIYEPLAEHPELVYSRAEIEELLRHELKGSVFDGPIRSRSKLAKAAVCCALGYPQPGAFKRVRPRFPGQDLDVYVQQHDNFQVWNEELSPTRRYVLLRVNEVGHLVAVRVAEGIELAAFDRTGTLTSKHQAKRRSGATGNKLVSPSDTSAFVAELEPAGEITRETLRGLLPTSPPARGKVLSVGALYDRLLGLVGREFEYSSSERLRGEQLHRMACEVLDLGSYGDTGRFPDIVCQALEVKLQTAPTIDLGLITPDSDGPATTLSPRLRHSDVRYLIAYAVHDTRVVQVDHIVVSTGADFFEEFQRFGGLIQNQKLQLHLPNGFFQTEQLEDGSI
jgi:hypothetical protein